MSRARSIGPRWRIAAWVAALACAPPPAADGVDATPSAGPAPRAIASGDLVDEARERGLAFIGVSGTPEKRDILEANGGGVAVLDLGGDGDDDLVFSQGCASLPALLAGPGADLALFVNGGGGRFAPAPAVGLAGWWTGLAAGDLDNDGDDDLVAAGYGCLRVLLQERDEAGEARLVPLDDAGVEPSGAAAIVPGAPRAAGVDAPSWATSLALCDLDGDGVLDLYVVRYLDLDPLAPPRGELGTAPLSLPCRWKSYEVFCGPRGLTPQADRFYRGLGDGRFVDATAESGVGALPPSYGLGVLALDVEGDGDTDLYVANDSQPNFLLLNVEGRFVERARAAGVALSQEGLPEAGMGAAAGDVDGDGSLDFCVTNFSGEPTELFLRTAQGFRDETYRSGLHAQTRALLSWGAQLVDLDGDGRLELFTANGHVYPQADLAYTGTSYGQPDTVWRFTRSDSGLRAEPLRATSERSLLAPASRSRGSAVGDFDGDGAADLAVWRMDDAPGLGMNRFAATRLALRLAGDPDLPPGPSGRRTPRDGHGARVALVLAGAATDGAPEIGLLAAVQGAVGYQSASTREVLYGLGERQEYLAVRVFWPSGRTSDLGPGRGGRRLWLREGEATPWRDEALGEGGR